MKQSTNLEAQNTSCLVTYDDIVGYDHCGWPLH